MTLIETVMSAAVLTMLIYFAATLVISGNRAQRYAQRVNRVTELMQDVVDEIRSEMTSAVRVFHNDTIGNAYLNQMDFTNATPGITYRLPILDDTGIFQTETVANTRSGNSLLFAHQTWSASYTTLSAAVYQVDVYRLVHYYPAPVSGGPQSGEPGGLDLVKWVSEPLVAAEHVDKITDPTDLAEVLKKMIDRDPDDSGVVHPRVEIVWKLGELPATLGTIRQILSDGSMSTSPQPPRTGTKLLRDERWSSNSMLAYRHHAVATNYAPSGWGVGKFSVVSNTGSGFPHGFELQLTGPSVARQLLVQLVMVSTNTVGTLAHGTIQGVIDARDL